MSVKRQKLKDLNRAIKLVTELRELSAKYKEVPYIGTREAGELRELAQYALYAVNLEKWLKKFKPLSIDERAKICNEGLKRARYQRVQELATSNSKLF